MTESHAQRKSSQVLGSLAVDLPLLCQHSQRTGLGYGPGNGAPPPRKTAACKPACGEQPTAYCRL